MATSRIVWCERFDLIFGSVSQWDTWGSSHVRPPLAVIGRAFSYGASLSSYRQSLPKIGYISVALATYIFPLYISFVPLNHYKEEANLPSSFEHTGKGLSKAGTYRRHATLPLGLLYVTNNSTNNTLLVKNQVAATSSHNTTPTVNPKTHTKT